MPSLGPVAWRSTSGRAEGWSVGSSSEVRLPISLGRWPGVAGDGDDAAGVRLVTGEQDS
jgi:hypothetical protein